MFIFCSVLLFLIFIDYVKHAHAPTVISRSMFSGAISLKCRHLRGEEKNKKGVAPIRKVKRKQTNENNHKANGNQQDAEASDESPIEDMEQDKENLIEIN